MHSTIRILPIVAATLVVIAGMSVSFVFAQSKSSVNGTNRTPVGPILYRTRCNRGQVLRLLPKGQ